MGGVLGCVHHFDGVPTVLLYNMSWLRYSNRIANRERTYSE